MFYGVSLNSFLILNVCVHATTVPDGQILVQDMVPGALRPPSVSDKNNKESPENLR